MWRWFMIRWLRLVLVATEEARAQYIRMGRARKLGGIDRDIARVKKRLDELSKT